jgi:hypothetical protein
MHLGLGRQRSECLHVGLNNGLFIPQNEGYISTMVQEASSCGHDSAAHTNAVSRHMFYMGSHQRDFAGGCAAADLGIRL